MCVPVGYGKYTCHRSKFLLGVTEYENMNMKSTKMARPHRRQISKRPQCYELKRLILKSCTDSEKYLENCQVKFECDKKMVQIIWLAFMGRISQTHRLGENCYILQRYQNAKHYHITHLLF